MIKLKDFLKKKDKGNSESDTVVFTTKNVMLDNMLITKVYHSSDNFFQFFDNESTNSNENIIIVGLDQITKKDASVTATLNMPPGHFASRETKQDKWIIESYTEDDDDDE